MSQMNDPELDRPDIIASFLNAGDYRSAEAFALSVDNGWPRAELLAQVARGLVAAGMLGDARRVWEQAIAVARVGESSESLQDSLDSASVLAEIAEDMAQAGEAEDARRVAAGIKHEWRRQGA